MFLQNDSGKTVEEEMWNGLYKGHAYSITGVLDVRILYFCEIYFIFVTAKSTRKLSD